MRPRPCFDSRILARHKERKSIPLLIAQFHIAGSSLPSYPMPSRQGRPTAGAETDFESEPSEPDAGHAAEGSSLGDYSVSAAHCALFKLETENSKIPP